MQETGGNGVGRLIEATGAPPMVNNCFSLLRYDVHTYLHNIMYVVIVFLVQNACSHQ